MGGGRGEGEGGVAQLSLRRAHITNRNEVSLLTLTCKTKTKEKTSVKTRTIQTVGHILIVLFKITHTHVHARTPRCCLIKYARKEKLYVTQTAMLVKQKHSERFRCLQGCNAVHQLPVCMLLKLEAAASSGLPRYPSADLHDDKRKAVSLIVILPNTPQSSPKRN